MICKLNTGCHRMNCNFHRAGSSWKSLWFLRWWRSCLLFIQPNIHYHNNKSPSLDSTLSQSILIHHHTPFPWDPFKYYPHIYAGFLNGIFPWGFLNWVLHTFLILSIHDADLVHLILLNLTTTIISDGEPWRALCIMQKTLNIFAVG